MVSPILELININKSFGHVQANKNINLTINKDIYISNCVLNVHHIEDATNRSKKNNRNNKNQENEN